ncbi:MAG: hypothetical protein A2734_01190 [Parcubacteria group bacterium RIFCSPHIGHO2_01_FULL_40_30]|nr:MAG: hypothetical protein A2734_01190 [Parcubacteria group bacterium RIFCSPHIGHO2_01_FULL_40_30]OHB23084.1 MAG: hypothetical protein A3I22_00025 [Parcubacteria group bacterium RIFCSPLOWO2_02_FULL_40_12]
MLVFVDDSGDPGFKLEKGSSRYFIIALVIFKDELEAEKTAVAIKEFRRSLKFPDEMEFKFHKSSSKIKEQFLKIINKFDFSVRYLVVDKRIIRSQELKSNKNSFYSYAIKMVLQYSNDEILDAKIKIDGSGDRVFRRNFITYLRKHLNSEQRKIMKNCKLVDSKENVLIQMADMIAGSIHRFYDKTKKDYEKFKAVINRHITDEWRFR